MDINKAFGEALRVIRLKRGISQEKMAPAASRIYVSALERGGRNPSLSMIDNLSSQLGIHPMELLYLTYTYKDELDSSAIIDLLSESDITGK